MAENKLYYPFDYRHHLVYSVALYGNNHPYIIKGHLVLRTYYTDDSKKKIDIAHTSDAVMDTVFFETNKVIREQMAITAEENLWNYLFQNLENSTVLFIMRQNCLLFAMMIRLVFFPTEIQAQEVLLSL